MGDIAEDRHRLRACEVFHSTVPTSALWAETRTVVGLHEENTHSDPFGTLV